MAKKYKTALFTGASSGLGKDMAERLLRNGYLFSAVDGAIILPMDVSKGDEIEAAVAQ